MKKVYSLITILMAWFFTACSGQTSNNALSPKQFSDKMAESKNITLLDVRTPGEFSEGHIKSAVNADWNGGGFERVVSGYDKSKTYFLYCRSGHRSGLAAEWMRRHGFKNVIELDGGISAWQSASLPVE
ncbi:MAG: rhodanese-like domain-containing protein [Bacteroidota bacterium]|jgi:rhodanese-related sulfurtransferase